VYQAGKEAKYQYEMFVLISLKLLSETFLIQRRK